jgi:hypothetical protein
VGNHFTFSSIFSVNLKLFFQNVHFLCSTADLFQLHAHAREHVCVCVCVCSFGRPCIPCGNPSLLCASTMAGVQEVLGAVGKLTTSDRVSVVRHPDSSQDMPVGWLWWAGDSSKASSGIAGFRPEPLHFRKEGSLSFYYFLVVLGFELGPHTC